MRKQSENLIMISESLANLYNEGILIESALLLLSELDLSKQYKKTILLVHKEVLKGATLAEAFKKHPKLFPPMFTGFIKIGEDNGKLARVLYALKDYYYVKQSIESKLKSAITYPCIIIWALFLVIIALFVLFLPKMCNMLLDMDKELTGCVKILYNYRLELENKPLLFFSRIISNIFIICFVLKILIENIDYKKKMKKIKIIRLYYENVLLLIFSIIYRSQGNVVQGLYLAKESIGNNTIKENLDFVYDQLIQGRELSYTMQDIDIVSKQSISFIKIGEKGGEIEEMLTKALNSNKSELIRSIDKKLKLIEPGLLVLLAIVICFILTNCVMPFVNSLYG